MFLFNFQGKLWEEKGERKKSQRLGKGGGKEEQGKKKKKKERKRNVRMEEAGRGYDCLEVVQAVWMQDTFLVAKPSLI